jgi:hypothetical protein
MDFTALIALFSFQLTIIVLVAIVYHKDELADKAISGLIRLLGRLVSKLTKQNIEDTEKSPKEE